MTQITQEFAPSVVSNTTLESQLHVVGAMYAKIDWLSLSFVVDGERRLNKLIKTVEQLLDITIYSDKSRLHEDFGGAFKVYSGTLGVTFSHTLTDSEELTKVRVTIPGTLLSDRKPWHIKRVCRKLHDNWQAKCTRIDLAVDDYAKTLDYDKLEQAIIDKCLVGTRSGKRVSSYGTTTAGDTIYFGDRRGAKFVRIYDRGAKTGGRDDCQRYEIEFKQQLAQAIYLDYISDTHADSHPLLSGIVKAGIDIRTKTDKNLSRSQPVQWWEDFKERITGTAKEYKRVKPEHSLDRTLRWIHRAVSKSLLIVKEAIGAETATELIDFWMHEARLRISQHDNDEIQRIRSEGMTIASLMDEY